MLHIILFVLKLILFLILAVLAIGLLIFLSVLLIPVKYQGEASLHERFSAAGTVSWLFHLIVCSFSYGEGGLKTELRILWFYPLQKKQEREAGLEYGGAPEKPADEDLVTAMENRTEEPLQEIFPGPTEFSASEKPRTETKEEKKCRKSLLERIRDKVEQIKKRFSLTVRRIKKNILNLKQKKDSLSSLLSDESNRKTFHLLLKEAKRLCRKLFPRITGTVTFGVEDPYLMGQILTVLAIFYPYYGRSFETAAAFNENVLEGDISVKGKFCLGTFAASVLRVIKDRNFRTLVKRFLREGGV